MSDDLEYRIGKLLLQPGDTLVVKVDRDISHDKLGLLRLDIAHKIRRDVRVLVIGPGIDISVLTRSEVEALSA